MLWWNGYHCKCRWDLSLNISNKQISKIEFIFYYTATEINAYGMWSSLFYLVDFMQTQANFLSDFYILWLFNPVWSCSVVCCIQAGEKDQLFWDWKQWKSEIAENSPFGKFYLWSLVNIRADFITRRANTFNVWLWHSKLHTQKYVEPTEITLRCNLGIFK